MTVTQAQAALFVSLLELNNPQDTERTTDSRKVHFGMVTQISREGITVEFQKSSSNGFNDYNAAKAMIHLLKILVQWLTGIFI